MEKFIQIITKEDLIEFNKHADRPLPLDIKTLKIHSNMYGMEKNTLIKFIIKPQTDVLMPTITVMQPRVINRDNTGDRSYDSEQGVIIKKSDIIFDYENREAKKRGFCI